MKSVLTEDLLASAERQIQAARAQGITVAGGYPKKDGLTASDQRRPSVEEKKKWLT